MVYLEVTKMRPLDVVLMSGTRVFSKVIMAASSLAAMRKANYSHATLMLSQSMCVEALDGVATVLTDYATRDKLVCRWVNGKLAVFVGLDGISDALVLRHKCITDASHVELEFRGKLLETLSELYLRQYSTLARLLKPVVSLPAPIMRFIEHATSGLDGFKPEPGPFCSELVCLLLDEVAPTPVSAAPTKLSPDAVSPSALEWIDDFLDPLWGERSPVHACNPQDLPGEPANDMSRKLVAMLSTGTDDMLQNMRATTLKVMTLVPKVVGGELDSEELTKAMDVIYAERRKEFRNQWINELDSYFATFSDPVWNWIERSNACMATCPDARQNSLPPKSQWPMRKPGFMTSLEALERRRYEWDGFRCPSTCDCVMAPFTSLERDISAETEALMQLQQAKVDEAMKRFQMSQRPS